MRNRVLPMQNDLAGIWKNEEQSVGVGNWSLMIRQGQMLKRHPRFRKLHRGYGLTKCYTVNFHVTN